MNFGSLLYAAQNNATQTSSDVRCYKTTFAAPKKEPPKHRTLSANVQKFLARKEEEKRHKEIKEKKKRDELLSLRSQDKMSVKRVSTMLKRTKSANKSVMEDAVDDVNTVVTMAGPSQCDEDDYGYVSQEASSFYNKLMDKYSNMPPEEDKFSKSKKVAITDLNAAKERVKATLNRIEEEEMMPRKRKRKSKETKEGEVDDFIDDEIRYRDRDEIKKEKQEEEEPKLKKPKRPAPPPMDFSQLLKIAEQKQHEPVVIEKKPVEDEDDKPMTKKQRLEYLREKEARIQKERRELEDKLRSKPSSSTTKHKDPPPSENSSRSSTSQQKVKSEMPSIPRIPKLNQSSEQSSKNSKLSSESPADKLQSIKIPKVSEREKVKNPGSSSSGSNLSLKPVPSSVAEEMLKKSSKVWSKPCNRSPSNSPNHRINSKIPSNRGDKLRDSLDSRSSTSSSNHCLDRRKETPEKQIVKKTSIQSSSDFDRRKELNNNINRENINREKLRLELEQKKLLLKQKLINDRIQSLDRKDNRSSRNDVSQSITSENVKKNNSSSTVKNGAHKSISMKNEDLPQTSTSNGDLHQKPRSNDDSHQKPRSNDDSHQKPRSNDDSHQKPRSSDNNHQKPRSNGDIHKKPRSNDDIYQKPKCNGDNHQKPRLNGDNHQKPKSNGDILQKPKCNADLNQKLGSKNYFQQKQDVKKGPSVLVDLFGDDFPNVENKSKSAVENSPSKLLGRPEMKNSLSSTKEHDERLGKSSSMQSSKHFDPKSKPSVSTSQNMRRPIRPDDKSVSDNKVQSRQFPPSDLKSKSQVSDKSKSADVKSRQFPPADVRPKQFPPPDMRPRQFPPSDVRRKPQPMKRRYEGYYDEDDEEEYDSEMDDFIDDDDTTGGFDYSSEISKMFKYDKNRYKNIDDDDIEEANFAQLMKEEVISTRIGIQEDLEEFLKEKAEKKRATQRKLQKLAEMRKKRR